MRHALLYCLPLAFDIIVSVSLFAGRHALAEAGAPTSTVGSILTMYGVGYIAASLLMGRIIKPSWARRQMMVSTLATAAILAVLAASDTVRTIQILFAILPLSASFFFNAYQTFMLGFDTGAGKPLTRTVAHYTGSWSIGFALGPLLASFIKKNINWPSAYLAAAVIAVAIGIAAFFFKPTGVKKSVAVSSTDGAGNKSLAPAAWIGLITGWTALNMIFTYWPVHAEHLSIDIGFKGAVEFSFAMAQALAAFAIAGMPSSYYYSPRLPFAALFGIVSMMLFASTSTPLIFITAAVLFGIYTAHILNAMVFHSMVEQDKAVRRIAINEVCVGVSFLISAPFSSAIRAFIPSISTAYLGIAIMLAAGLALESVVMAKLRKKPSDDLSA